jgi:hypothetical protein
MDELGTLVTKAESMKNTKRTRDAFDVVLALYQARDLRKLAADVAALRCHHHEAFEELRKLEALKTEPRLRENVAKYWGRELDDSTWRTILGGVNELALGSAPISAQAARCGVERFRRDYERLRVAFVVSRQTNWCRAGAAGVAAHDGFRRVHRGSWRHRAGGPGFWCTDPRAFAEPLR